MRRLVVALAVPFILAAGSRPAGACSCTRPIGCHGDRAAALFVGRILDVKTEGDHQDASFEVERGAKGAHAGQIVVVRTAHDRSTCDLDFAAGQRWLIVAHGPAPLSAGACSGSFQVRDGESGPAFLDRGGVSGTVEQWDPAGRGEPVRMRGVRVWVETMSGVVETRTGPDGGFYLRDVPLLPARPLHFDVGPGLRVSPMLVASWTPEVCRTVTVQAQPAGKGP